MLLTRRTQCGSVLSLDLVLVRTVWIGTPDLEFELNMSFYLSMGFIHDDRNVVWSDHLTHFVVDILFLIHLSQFLLQLQPENLARL